MRKRIIALLLALILTVGLLPTVALAADAQPDVQVSKSDDNLNLVKTIKKAGENYTVTLESWATGTVTSSSTPVPMDIILLLDQSGSMNSDFTSSSSVEYNRLYKRNQKIYEDYRARLYIYNGSGYVKVSVEKETILFSKDKFTYTWSGGSYVSYGERDYPDMTFYYQSTNSSKTTKIAALKSAVRSFIGKVNEEATSKNVEHRVAIVGFASTKSGKKYKNTELLSTQNEVNYANANASNYEDALVSAKTEKKRLSTAIDRLDANDDTYPEYGFDMANKIFAQHPIQAGDNRQRVVIMFTDGYPAPANTDNFNVGMANNAINNAKRCKDNNAKVYTIGIFDGADPSASIENYSQNGWLNEAVAANRYMHFSSSNYPSAMALNNGGTKGEGNFYFAASNADALNDIFDTISEEISTDTTELDDSATIIDNIPGNFAIPEDAKNITLKVAKFQKDGTFATATTAPTTVTAEHKDGTVTVTGFNFSDEWCGLNESDQPHGSKLIIEFTIHHNNYGGTQPTNAGASIKDEAGKEVIKVDDPTVPVTISKPDDVFTQANEKTYDGTGFDIFDEVAKKADDLANGTNNAFVDIEVKITVEGTDYIYTISKGQQSGTWKQTASPKTSPNVKDEDKNGTPEAYEYPVTITFKDAAEDSTASNSTTATAKFTINYAEAKVKANDKNKKATEADPDFDATVTGMVNDEDATQKLTYTISRTDADDNTVGDHQTITPIGDTYQNNYKVTYETGTLTITKDDTTEIELIIVGNTLEQTYNGQVHTANNYKVTYPAGTSSTDFQIVTSKTASISATDVKTTAEGTVDADGRYMMGLTAEDFTVTSEKYGKIKVTYTDGWLKITPIAITLKSGSDTKTYDGVALTKNEVTVISGSFVSDEGLDYNVTGSQTVVGTSKNTYNYAAKAGTTLTNYTITQEEGDLTVTLPDLTARPNVIVNCVNTEVPAHTEKNTSLTNADHYTVSTEATKVDGQSAYTRTITLTEAGKNHFISSEYVPEYGSHTPATNGNVTEITMTYSEVNGEWEWRASHTNFLLNVECTTPTVEVDLGTLIKKDFSAKSDSKPIPNGNYTFTAQIFAANDTWQQVGESPVYTGTATLNGAASGAAFDFGSSRNTTLASGTHRYLVKEEHGGETIDGITYDSTVYRLTITVSEDGTQPNVQIEAEPQASVLSVQSVAFDKTITFTNTYSEKKDPGKNTIDFSDFVFKVLTKTGDRSFNGAEFTATVDGWKVNQYDVMSARVIKTHFVDLQPVTLKATFTADTPFENDKAYRGFMGDKLTVTAGRYLFLIDEINDGQTNITYDESKYWLNLGFVENAEGEVSLAGQRVRKFVDGDTYETVLALEDSEWMIVDTSISPVYFENTIDTGKDDYYPIIIPTIINKDTGMLNKTDHFAYVIGYPDGTVHPNGQITRAEVATIFFRLLRDEVRDGAFTTSNTYSDVAYGKWYNNPISTMSALGIITGYPDGTFKPNKPITRAEFAAIAARFDETQSGKSATFSDVIGHWAAKEIGIAYYNDWIKGYPDGTFKPDQNITRAEAMTLINRVLERKPESPADLLTNMNKWTDNLDTSKWYYLDVQEATNSHGYTRKTFNYELWRQMLPDPDWSRYER
mgnify:CR=1 FL=1